jgi:DNA-binding MarR family transcriptional regulator
VARLVKDLLDAGLLVRSPHPVDRRSHTLTASGPADEACKRLERAEALVAAQLFDGMTAAEVDDFAQRLLTLRGRLGQ